MTGPAAFQVVAKPVGARCNLRCRYCFYLDRAGLAGGTGAMPDAVLERYVARYIEEQDAPDVHFVWQGGEPTLPGIDFYRRALDLQRRHTPPGKRVHNALQTNGVLLDDDWGCFLREHDFLVGLSVDGPRDMTDRNRVDVRGGGAFERIVKGAAVLRRHRVRFNLLCCVHRDNARRPLETYTFLKRLGTPFLQFIPIAERRPGTATAQPWSVRPEDYGTFLVTVFDHWVRHDVGRVFVQVFDAQLAVRTGLPPGLCVYAETCGQAPALERNGDVYPCDHFVEPARRLGNILADGFTGMLGDPRQVRFGAAKRDALPGQCRRCTHLAHCRGECPKSRWLVTDDGEPGLQYLCAGLRRFFAHSEPYLDRMTALLRSGRPAAAIMAELTARGRRGTDPRPRRNDACPCGSGRKFKRCCARR